MIYYSEKAGYSVEKNLIFMRAITDKSHKSKLHQWIQNETLIDISCLNDEKIDFIIHRIIAVSRNESMMLTYASTYDTFRDYFIRNGKNIAEKAKFTGMISSSEMFLMILENGIIGQDKGKKNMFFISEANYIVEIFDMESDRINKRGRNRVYCYH